MSSGTGLSDVQDTWERLAQIDPLWAVLSEPDKLGRRWDVGEFLETGEEEIGNLVNELRPHGLAQFHKALDFGCGAGRLSIALASRFQEVVAVDIAPTMIETARKISNNKANIRFIVNDRNDLSALASDSFDLVYSNIVLQHMPPENAAEYINEFYRVAKPGGFVVFQIPSHLTDEWLPGGNNGTRLPDGAHRATIEVVRSPSRLHAGEKAAVCVRVRNASDQTWAQDLTNQINLGNHWLREDGTEVIHDDGRQRLPGSLSPGQSCELELKLQAPNHSGHFLLELDVVQEGVNWFADMGSPTTRCEVTVEDVSASTQAPTFDTAAEATSSKYPTFMMNGISFEETKAIIEKAGGEILQVYDHVTEWVSYRYVTRRCGDRARQPGVIR